jgi:Transposase DDE domain group 1
LRGSSWCERNRVAHVFGLAGNKVLLARVIDLADEAAVSRVEGEGTKVCSYDEFLYAARTWATERRVITRGGIRPRRQPRRHAPLALRGRLLCQRPGGEPDEAFPADAHARGLPALLLFQNLTNRAVCHI